MNSNEDSVVNGRMIYHIEDSEIRDKSPRILLNR